MGERPKQLPSSLPQAERGAKRDLRALDTRRVRLRAIAGCCVRLRGVSIAVLSPPHAVAALLAAAALFVAGCGQDTPPVAKLSAAEVQARLAKPIDQPQVLRELQEEAGEVIVSPASPVKLLDARVAALRGLPVVVNVWADWCAPCKKEMPIFQRVALDQRGEVGFLGVASRAPKAKSVAYLKDIAMPYPSVIDEPGKVIDLTGVDGLPKTFFYTPAGKRFVHNGPYKTQAELLADIKRYTS